MKKSSSELKRIAKGVLAGHYGIAAGATLIIMLMLFISSIIVAYVFPITNLTSYLTYLAVEIIVSLLIGIFIAGLKKMFLNLSRGEQAGLGDLLYAFSNRPDKIIILDVLLGLLFIGCCLPGGILFYFATRVESLPLLIPALLLYIAGGVIALILYFGYSMASYLYLDNPEMGCIELLRESRLMMRRNKGRLFYLSISFFGWMLLGACTCYIGFLWLMPYIMVTENLFYRDLRGEL